MIALTADELAAMRDDLAVLLPSDATVARRGAGGAWSTIGTYPARLTHPASMPERVTDAAYRAGANVVLRLDAAADIARGDRVTVGGRLGDVVGVVPVTFAHRVALVDLEAVGA